MHVPIESGDVVPKLNKQMSELVSTKSLYKRLTQTHKKVAVTPIQHYPFIYLDSLLILKINRFLQGYQLEVLQKEKETRPKQ